MKLIIFDLDGTLLDTLDDLTNSVNYAMDMLSLPRYDSGQVKNMVGNGVAVLMRRAVTASQAEMADCALQLQRQYYNKYTDIFTKPFDGITETLLRLKLTGFTIAVHTNKDENCAIKLCGKYFKNLIDHVLGTTADNVTKPDPKKVLELISKLGVSRQNAVYCGDSDVDLQTAGNAELKCISVAWGFKNINYLRQCGAKYIAESPSEIVDIANALVAE